MAIPPSGLSTPAPAPLTASGFDWRPDPAQFHLELARFNQRRLAVGLPDADWVQTLQDDLQHQLDEGAFLEAMREEVSALAARAPTAPEAFVHWFEQLRAEGPGQHDPLFDWLAREASLAQMRWFLMQEAAGEAGFEDLLAQVQLKMPLRPKLAMARNFWDEMGRGKTESVHGELLAALVAHLGLAPRLETTVWEALALANTMVGLACNRRYAYQAVGALGVIELTAPDRVACVARGLERLGIDRPLRHYFELHSAIDLRHARDWNRDVIAPLVRADARCARHIAEGALMRLTAGARCFRRYREALWSAPPAAAAP